MQVAVSNDSCKPHAIRDYVAIPSSIFQYGGVGVPMFEASKEYFLYIIPIDYECVGFPVFGSSKEYFFYLFPFLYCKSCLDIYEPTWFKLLRKVFTCAL